jgi:hypothetical protein
MPSRQEFITSLIGKPWQANAKGPDSYDCWHLATHVQKELFHRNAPHIQVPEVPTWPWMISQFRFHPELRNWKEIPNNQTLLYDGLDGAIVLMARHSNPAHCGVLLAKEGAILHCDQRSGVVFQEPMDLKMEGWAKLRFFVPA